MSRAFHGMRARTASSKLRVLRAGGLRALVSVLAVFSAASRAGEARPALPPGIDETTSVTSPSPEGPKIFAHTRDAGPDQTFFLVGDGLTNRLIGWGPPMRSGQATRFDPAVRFCNGRYLAVTIPQSSPDGVLSLGVESDRGMSRTIVLNAPEAWWLMPDKVEAGGEVAVFGRNLARRPDFDQAFVWLSKQGSDQGAWLPVTERGKYRLRTRLPEDLAEGAYRLWCHVGSGGQLGWSEPLALQVVRPASRASFSRRASNVTELLAAVHEARQAGGGTIRLAEGAYRLDGTLKLPAGVLLQGAGRDKTLLQCALADPVAFRYRLPAGWNYSPRRVGAAGDEMEYTVELPADGAYSVWMRYACDMSWRQKPGVSGCSVLIVDDGPPVTLENLPNTMGYEWYLWSRTASITLTRGRHKFVWRNVQGGDINMDAILLSADDGFVPTNEAFPVSSDKSVVVQAEDFVAMRAAGGYLPDIQHVAVQLAGDGAGLTDLSVQGNTVTETGVMIRHEQFPRWIGGSVVRNVKICGLDGRGSENRGVHLCYAERAEVSGSEVLARAPIYFSGVRQCTVRGNRLMGVTRSGGGAEGAILGRTNIIEQCAVEDNVLASPPGVRGGVPTVRRMIWVSTGHGSVSCNWFARNRAEGAGFAGLPGTDQNVGETILLEACQRISYFGPVSDADERSVALPATLPATPDDRLGTVSRGVLPRDAAGNETPFWPPAKGEDDGLREPTIDQYYVTILRGSGAGQTRRAFSRAGTRIVLDRPWDVPPLAGDQVLVSTLFYRNLIVDNDVPDGMSGIQLWLSCVENIVAGNRIADHRRQAMYVLGSATTLASSMPQMWNRGLAPSYFNTFESNRTQNTATGCLVSARTGGKLLVDFPLALGNVVRQNSLIDNRFHGVDVDGARGDEALNIGSILEHNLVRNCEGAAFALRGGDHVVLRRNMAHFWRPPAADQPRAVFQFDSPGTWYLGDNVEEVSHVGKVRSMMERHTYKE